MKSTGMDANKVMLNCRMTYSLLRVFILLILMGQPTLVFTEDANGPTATIKILPEYTTEPREGDSVTLDCEISSIQLVVPDDVLWARRDVTNGSQTIIVRGKRCTINPCKRFSISLVWVVNSAGLYSYKITIHPLRRSDDQGLYQCFVNVSSITINSTEVPLLVHRREEFPICTPDGPATVTIGSSLSCKTLSDTRMPIVSDIEMQTATNDGWVTSPTNAGGSPGQELIKTVTNSEHGKTFRCFSTSDVSSISPACKIGPLVVVPETTGTGTETVNTTMIITGPGKQQSAGLSGADIAGIVIGVILLLIIIAVHTLCCRCNPKRWLYAKSYPVNVEISFGTSRERDNAALTQPDTELGSSEPQTGNLYSGFHQASTESGIVTATYGSDIEDDHQPVTTPSTSSEQPHPTSTDPHNKLPEIYAEVQKTTPVTDSKEPTEPQPPAVYAQVIKKTPITDTKESTEPKSQVVYAKVTKTTPITDTLEPINSQPNPSVTNAQMDENAPHDDAELLKENGKGSSKLQNIANIKRFGQNRNGRVVRPPKPEPVIIYAELDLPETGSDEVRHPLSDDSQTVYAEIKHESRFN